MEEGGNPAKTEPVPIEERKESAEDDKIERMISYIIATLSRRAAAIERRRRARAQGEPLPREDECKRPRTMARLARLRIAIGDGSTPRPEMGELSWMLTTMKEGLPKTRKTIEKRHSKPSKVGMRHRTCHPHRHDYIETYAEQDVLLLLCIQALNLHNCTDRERARELIPEVFTAWQEEIRKNRLVRKAYAVSVWQLWSRAVNIIRAGNPLCAGPETKPVPVWMALRVRGPAMKEETADVEEMSTDEDGEGDAAKSRSKEKMFMAKRKKLVAELTQNGNWEMLCTITKKRSADEKHARKLKLSDERLAEEIENLSLGAVAPEDGIKVKEEEMKIEESPAVSELGDMLREVIVSNDGNDGGGGQSGDGELPTCGQPPVSMRRQ